MLVVVLLAVGETDAKGHPEIDEVVVGRSDGKDAFVVCVECGSPPLSA